MYGRAPDTPVRPVGDYLDCGGCLIEAEPVYTLIENLMSSYR